VSFVVTSPCKEIHSLLILTISISTDGQFHLLIVCAFICTLYVIGNVSLYICVMYYPRLSVKIWIKMYTTQIALKRFLVCNYNFSLF